MSFINQLEKGMRALDPFKCNNCPRHVYRRCLPLAPRFRIGAQPGGGEYIAGIFQASLSGTDRTPFEEKKHRVPNTPSHMIRTIMIILTMHVWVHVRHMYFSPPTCSHQVHTTFPFYIYIYIYIYTHI